MNCGQFDAELDQGLNRADLSEEAGRHLAECARCRALYGWISEGGSAEVPLAIRARIVGSLSGSLGPVARLAPLHVTVLRLLTAFVILFAVLLAIMGTAGIERMTAAQLLVMSVLLAAGAGLFSISVSGQMRPGAPQYLRSAFVPYLLSLGAIAMLFPWVPPAGFVAQGWPCLAGGAAMAAAAAVPLGAIVRRGAPVSARKMAFTLGAAAGWLGITVLQYRCPYQQAGHLLVWHGGVLLLSATAGLALSPLARRFHLRPRRIA